MRLIARLKCAIYGHRRGTRVSETLTWATYRCPRCKVQWTRKKKVASIPAPTDSQGNPI